jgi:hypothetical protein
MLLLTPDDLARDHCRVGSDGSVTLLDPDGSPLVAAGPPLAGQSHVVTLLLDGRRRRVFKWYLSARECQQVGLVSVAWRALAHSTVWGCQPDGLSVGHHRAARRV